MRFRIFYIVIMFCSIHGAFGMQEQPHRGIWASMRQKVYSACHFAGRCALAAKNLALAGIKWAWNKKLDFALLTAREAAEEYFWPTEEQVQAKTRKEKIWEGSMQAGMYGIMGWSRAGYVNYQDELGAEQPLL